MKFGSSCSSSVISLIHWHPVQWCLSVPIHGQTVFGRCCRWCPNPHTVINLHISSHKRVLFICFGLNSCMFTTKSPPYSLYRHHSTQRLKTRHKVRLTVASVPVTILLWATSSTIGEKQKTKCVDDNPTIARSIVDCGSRFFGLTDYIHIYEGCGVRITYIERGIEAAITTIMLSMTTKIFMVDSK